jgi:hypothetical protein
VGGVRILGFLTSPSLHGNVCRIGRGGLETVLRNFGIDRFVADWNALFVEVGA